jgi:indole-3-glycerol phosphate synthase
MKTALDRIIDYKHDEVRALKAARSVSDLEAAAKAASPVRGFCAALAAVADKDQNALICEIKRKSPSAGDILPGADPAEIARDYERGGAACLSVLTDMPSFGGSLADFEAIRDSVSIPMLRKDFMIDPVQIIEARAHGADCILIIMSAVSDALAGELHDCATGLGMDVLIETHDEEEMDRALRLPSPLIGVNNRDLKKAGRHLVSESGIADPESIIRLRKVGSRRFLIGEWLMKQGAERSEQVKRLKLAC